MEEYLCCNNQNTAAITEALECDICEKWTHAACIGMGKPLYTIYRSITANKFIVFLCAYCSPKMKTLSSHAMIFESQNSDSSQQEILKSTCQLAVSAESAEHFTGLGSILNFSQNIVNVKESTTAVDEEISNPLPCTESEAENNVGKEQGFPVKKEKLSDSDDSVRIDCNGMSEEVATVYHVKRENSGTRTLRKKAVVDLSSDNRKVYKNYAGAKMEIHSCKYCNQTFPTRTKVEMHEKVVHIDKNDTRIVVRRFWCNVCTKAFSRQTTLKEHQVMHTGEKQFSCNICKKKFIYSASLHRHRKLHSRINCVCGDCGKSFTSFAARKFHHRTAHGDKPYL